MDASTASSAAAMEMMGMSVACAAAADGLVVVL